MTSRVALLPLLAVWLPHPALIKYRSHLPASLQPFQQCFLLCYNTSHLFHFIDSVLFVASELYSIILYFMVCIIILVPNAMAHGMQLDQSP